MSNEKRSTDAQSATTARPVRKTLPPGPKGHFLLGSLLDFTRDPLGFVTHCAREYGDVVPMRMGPLRAVQINHPDLIEQVLVTDNRNFVKHFYTRLLGSLLRSNGLVISNGDFWRRQRRLAQPAFHRQRIVTYGDIMVSYGQRMLSRWQDGATLDVHAEMMRVTLEIVSKALLDAEMAEVSNTVGASLEVLMETFEADMGSPVILPEFIPTSINRRMRHARQDLDDIVYRIIEQRRASGEDKGDLLSMLMNARDEADGSQMTTQQLRDEVLILFLAGHETTANALTWTWYLLAQQPEVEAKLLAELNAVLGGRTPTVADLPQLGYAERVITESMRLYPPVWAIGREPVQDCEIGGYRIPAGTTLFLSQWVVHHDPRYYERPAVFEPDRWAGDLSKRLPKFAYFPFGGGPRLCIGNSFAMTEATLLLATIAQQYHLTLDSGHAVTPWPSVTLRPKEGLRMKLNKR